jgi:hypothetical protein
MFTGLIKDIPPEPKVEIQERQVYTQSKLSGLGMMGDGLKPQD